MAKEKQEGAENAEAKNLTQEYFEEKAAKSAENLAKGGKEVEIDLVSTIEGRITKDFGFFKKGHVQHFSPAAFEIYDKKGVVEKVN